MASSHSWVLPSRFLILGAILLPCILAVSSHLSYQELDHHRSGIQDHRHMNLLTKLRLLHHGLCLLHRLAPLLLFLPLPTMQRALRVCIDLTQMHLRI